MKRMRGGAEAARRVFCAGVVILGFLLGSPTASAVPPGSALPPQAQRLQRALRGLRGIEAEFLQIRSVALTGEEIEARGFLAFRPPHAFRIAYRTPEPQELVIRGDSLWVIMPKENQAQRYPFCEDSPGSEIFLLFGGHRKALEDAFEITQEPWGGHAQALRLRPRHPEPGYPIEEMRLVLRDDGLPRRLFFRDASGDDVAFTFLHYRRNPPDIAQRVGLHLPPGIEVIDASPTGLGDAPGIDPKH